MNVKSNRAIARIFDDWHVEDRLLEACLDELRDWMREVNQLGIPHFGETATRLLRVRERLSQHFDREDELISALAKSYPPTSPEISATRRQSSLDHRQLLDRLNDLIQRLNELEPPFDSWQAAMDEVELFVVALEQHEVQESESVEMLIPRNPEDSPK